MRTILAGLLLCISFATAACSGGDAASSSSTTTSGTGGSGAGGTGSGGHVATSWEPTPTEGAPALRYDHTAVWTGSRMIVWGGTVLAKVSVTATGALYDPVARTWTPTSMQGAPPARTGHTAVWTGSRMIVWGGYGETGYESTGGLYDPATDTWSPMSTAGAPPGRNMHAGVWTGHELVVWGGFATTPIASGGRYDPSTDTWTALPPAGAPTARFDHVAVWADDRAIFWGGNDTFDWHLDGVSFDPAAGAWLGPTATEGAAERREGPSAVWTGSRMLIWGGWNGGPYLDTGGLFDPHAGTSGAWTATSVTGAPTPRHLHASAWLGSRLMVWGGCGADACGHDFDDGGYFTPGADGGTWTPIAPNTALGARRDATAVWTGSEVIIWGGRAGMTPLQTGAQGLP